jgi:hypothetical protein
MLNFCARNDPEGPHDWPYIYFHGQAEDLVDEKWNKTRTEEEWSAPDLVASDTQIASVADGTYDVTVYAHPAKLFIWSRRDIMCRGLIVLEGDQKSMADAERKFAAKVSSL